MNESLINDGCVKLRRPIVETPFVVAFEGNAYELQVRCSDLVAQLFGVGWRGDEISTLGLCNNYKTLLRLMANCDRLETFFFERPRNCRFERLPELEIPKQCDGALLSFETISVDFNARAAVVQQDNLVDLPISQSLDYPNYAEGCGGALPIDKTNLFSYLFRGHNRRVLEEPGYLIGKALNYCKVNAETPTFERSIHPQRNAGSPIVQRHVRLLYRVAESQ